MPSRFGDGASWPAGRSWRQWRRIASKMVAIGPRRTASEMKAGGHWRVEADGERMRQRWNPRMRGADGGEDGGGARMRRRQQGADSRTLECRKLDVDDLGNMGMLRNLEKKGRQKEIAYYRRVWPRRVRSNKKSRSKNCPT